MADVQLGGCSALGRCEHGCVSDGSGGGPIDSTGVASPVVVEFQSAGNYRLTVTVTESGGSNSFTTTGVVDVTVAQTATSIRVSSVDTAAGVDSVTVPSGGSEPFFAEERDQFGNPMATQPSFA